MWNKLFTPMLLSEEKEVINKKNYLYELKYDGMRTLIYVSPINLKIITRNKKDVTHLFPELNTIKELVKNKTIFDGEIICMENGLPSFSKLQSRLHLKNTYKINNQSINNTVTFICFDIIYQDKNLNNLKLIERKKILDKINDNNVFVKSFYILNNGKKLYKNVLKLGMEGIVEKDINSTYEINVRSTSWIKVKNIKTNYFYIGGYTYNNTNLFSVYLGEYKNNKLYYVGKVFIKKKNILFEELKKIHSNINPFYDFKNEIQFVKVIKKIKIKYIERTKNNHLRQPFYDI